MLEQSWGLGKEEVERNGGHVDSMPPYILFYNFKNYTVFLKYLKLPLLGLEPHLRALVGAVWMAPLCVKPFFSQWKIIMA